MRRALPLALLALLACRQQLRVDTSESAYIPRDVALDGLNELLPSAEGAEWAKRRVEEVRAFDEGLELRPPGGEPLRLDFKDVSGSRLDKVALYYQVRLFTAEQPDLVRLNWTSEADARRALELLDALRGKSLSAD